MSCKIVVDQVYLELEAKRDDACLHFFPKAAYYECPFLYKLDGWVSTYCFHKVK